MADARILKFDVGSPTDQTLSRLKERLHASSGFEAMRRSLVIADKVTEFSEKGGTLYLKDEDGTLRELIFS